MIPHLINNAGNISLNMLVCIETRGIILFRKQPTKVLINLHERAALLCLNLSHIAKKYTQISLSLNFKIWFISIMSYIHPENSEERRAATVFIQCTSHVKIRKLIP